ncbi:MAG: DUF1700 domain-containing protein [Candidatus Izemoplasmatales bacterium]|nr:DUF1700 domain-containing protein [Candidatus Izemoplasmatales bacterium]
MNRKTFLNELRKELKFYKKINTEEIIYYYDEMIQDAVDEGQDESLFIKNLGSIDSIIANIIKDEEFIKDVKTSNKNSLTNIIGGTVKVISWIGYYFSLFVLTIVYASIFLSGLGLIFQAGVYFIVDEVTTMDQWVLIGMILMGIGIAMIGYALLANIYKTNNSIRLFIIRKTKQIYRKKGERNNE